MDIHHVLVPYDGSKDAKKAFNYAADLSVKYNSLLTVITSVLGGSPMPYPYNLWRAPNLKKAEIEKKVKKSFEVLKNKAKKENVMVQFHVLEHPSVVQSIINFVENHNVDLVVIGSKGNTGFKKLVMGSVSSGVSQYCKCPVLIVK